jgi:hypothetical protein
MKEKVIAILASHDALRAEDRAAFAQYLHSVFTKAESHDATAAFAAQLDERLTALETKALTTATA